MIWADGRAQPAELSLLETFVRKHVARINAMANQQLLTYSSAGERFDSDEKRTYFEIAESLH